MSAVDRLAGEIPDYVHAFAGESGITSEQVRWCRLCGVVAFAIDDYQRAELDGRGFTRYCPTCRGLES